MARTPEDSAESSIEECIDELDGCIEQLDRFAPPVLALALRVHLGALLRAMVDSQACTREYARQFVRELEQEALGVE